MDARDLTRPPADPATAAIVTAYLAELHRRLPAGRRERGRIAAEIADGLEESIADLVERGVPARSAARRAVREFGDPATVARAFAGRLGPIAAHRAGVGLVVTGPFVGLAWIVGLAGVATGWTAGLGRVVTALPMLPVLLVITVPAALVAAAGAGRLARRTAVPARWATAAAVLAAGACASVDASLLTMAALRSVAAGRPAGPVLVAALASALRLTAAGWMALRVGRLRAAAH